MRHAGHPGPFTQLRATLQQFVWPHSDPQEPGAGAQTIEQEYTLFLSDLNDRSFYWRIWFVAAAGFFVDSYHLFSSNVFLPAFGALYWTDGSYHYNLLAFNAATLGASAIGQVFFGIFADTAGRRSLYGIELVIVVISTLGMLQSSQGYADASGYTWSITGWIFFWRIVMGVGIGAEYPLSACISAEWSPAKWRGRTMSAVFLMQPIGQISAYFAGLTALGFCDPSPLGIDSFWRYVVGIGAIPTLLALIARLIIPETGRYYFEVEKRIQPALSTPMDSSGAYSSRSEFSDTLRQYLFERGYWIYLAGTMACWLLLDIAFYGVGFNNSSTLSRLWASHELAVTPGAPDWLATSGTADVISNLVTDQDFAKTLKDVLYDNITRGIYTVSIASVFGSLCMMFFIDYFPRKHFLTVTFIVLGLIMVVIAASFDALFHQEGTHSVLIMLWALMSFLFSFGPNTLTFIFPAEVFPTRYRCTFYGIAAASGKIGAVIVQVVLWKVDVSGNVNSDNLKYAIAVFAVCMFLGAAFSHFTLPGVQKKRDIEHSPPWYQDLPLEELPPSPPLWTRRLRSTKQTYDRPVVLSMSNFATEQESR